MGWVWFWRYWNTFRILPKCWAKIAVMLKHYSGATVMNYHLEPAIEGLSNPMNCYDVHSDFSRRCSLFLDRFFSWKSIFRGFLGSLNQFWGHPCRNWVSFILHFRAVERKPGPGGKPPLHLLDPGTQEEKRKIITGKNRSFLFLANFLVYIYFFLQNPGPSGKPDPGVMPPVTSLLDRPDCNGDF